MGRTYVRLRGSARTTRLGRWTRGASARGSPLGARSVPSCISSLGAAVTDREPSSSDEDRTGHGDTAAGAPVSADPGVEEPVVEDPGVEDRGVDDPVAADATAGDDHGDQDDLDGFQTTMARVFGRLRLPLGILVVLAMLIPAGGWVLDRLAIRSAGGAVEEALGDGAAITTSLLLVRSVDCAGRSRSGSAFSLELDGEPTVVTNRHVVEGARSTIVQDLDAGPGVQVRSVLLAESADVAVLNLDEGELPPALPGGPEAGLGQPIVTVGFPGARPAFREGRIDRVEGGRLLLALEVGAGASGSPVLDDQGRVVGQVYARTADGRGVATPLTDVLGAARDAVPAPACP